MKQNKKGGFTIKQLLGLILGAVCLWILFIIFFAIFNPGYNEIQETSKGYAQGLKEQIKIAEKGETGELYLWPLPGDSDDASYYLVYFADTFTLAYQGKKFISEEAFQHSLCICSYQEHSSCKEKNCIGLGENIGTHKGEKEPWIIPEGHKIKITYKKGEYLFDSPFTQESDFAIGKISWEGGNPSQEIEYQKRKTTINIKEGSNPPGVLLLYLDEEYIGSMIPGKTIHIKEEYEEKQIFLHAENEWEEPTGTGTSLKELEHYKYEKKEIVKK